MPDVVVLAVVVLAVVVLAVVVLVVVEVAEYVEVAAAAVPGMPLFFFGLLRSAPGFSFCRKQTTGV